MRMSGMCRECYKEGFQPFAGATAISFWIKSNAPPNDTFASDYPAGTVSIQLLAACLASRLLALTVALTGLICTLAATC
jgi:hypothetical protein